MRHALGLAREAALTAGELAGLLAATMVCRVTGHKRPTWHPMSTGYRGVCPRCCATTHPPPGWPYK